MRMKSHHRIIDKIRALNLQKGLSVLITGDTADYSMRLLH